MQAISEYLKALNQIQGNTIHDKERKIAFFADDILFSLTETQASIQCLKDVLEAYNPMSVTMTKTEVMPSGSNPARTS